MQIAPEIKREARKIARRVVKDAIRAKGLKLSFIHYRDIQTAAEVLILHPKMHNIIFEAWEVCKVRYEQRQ